LPEFRLPHKFRDLLHAANLRHGTDGFTSPPKEGVLRNFFMYIHTCVYMYTTDFDIHSMHMEIIVVSLVILQVSE